MVFSTHPPKKIKQIDEKLSKIFWNEKLLYAERLWDQMEEGLQEEMVSE